MAFHKASEVMKKMMMILMACISIMMAEEASAVKLVFQTRAHGKDCEKDRGLCIAIEIEIKEILDIPKLSKVWHADANCIGDELILNTRAIGMPWNGDDFVVDSDLKLKDNIAKALGYNSVIIKRGVYKIDYSKNKMGDISLSVIKN